MSTHILDKINVEVPGTKTTPELLAAVKEHIERFAVVKLHYFRKYTQKILGQ